MAKKYRGKQRAENTRKRHEFATSKWEYSEIIEDTDQSICFRMQNRNDKGANVWLPRELLRLNREDMTVTIPDWLAGKNLLL